MSFFSAAERLAAIDHSTVKLVASRCLHTRDKFAECAACFDVCPAHAIITGKPPILDTEKCQTCLACLPTCPTGAYTVDDAVSAVLNCVGRMENNVIELVCAKHPVAELGSQQEAVGVRIRGCLAGLGSGTYMILAALGVEKVIIRTDACGSCDWGVLHGEIEAQVSQARLLLTPWEKAHTVKCLPVLENPLERPLWQADNPPLSRRDLFRLAARQGKMAMARAIENGKMVTDLRPGRDRLRTLEAVAHLHEFVKTTTSLAGMNFAWLSVTEVCTACGVCGRTCPTGALIFVKSENETTYTLNFSARNCIGCEICVHVCAPEAVSINHKPTFNQVFDLEMVTFQGGELTRCVQCKTLFSTQPQPDVHLCPQCEYRRIHPFGSLLPPGARLGKPVEAEKQHS